MAKKDKSRALTEDDLVVWRRVARTARPLKGRSLPDDPAPPAAVASAPASPLPRASPPPAPARPAAKRPAPPAQIGGEKKMRRGRVEVEASLDLHGMTLTQARTALGRFLAHSRAQGARVVIVVTGKGRAGEGALRREVPLWLQEEAAHVTGYAEAHQRHGGGGALYVRLRKLEPR